jgi:CheY-like chemotaxis protein
MEALTSNKVIMLIDDDAITNMINTKVIKMNYNFQVHDYVNAQFALDQLAQWCNSFPEKMPSVIFLDINMPIMDGWEFLEAFEKLPNLAHDRLKIFVLTSSIDVEDIEKAKTFRIVSDFVSKPLTAQKLKELI